MSLFKEKKKKVYKKKSKIEQTTIDSKHNHKLEYYDDIEKSIPTIKNELHRIEKELNFENLTVKKYINFGIFFSFINTNLGMKAHEIVSKIFNNFLSKTPITCLVTSAGLLKGPIILKIVLFPIFFLTGPTNLIAL